MRTPRTPEPWELAESLQNEINRLRQGISKAILGLWDMADEEEVSRVVDHLEALLESEEA